MSRIAAVEPRIPPRQRGDEGRGSEQGAVGLAGGDVHVGRGAGEVLEVEDGGGEGAVGGGGGDG